MGFDLKSARHWAEELLRQAIGPGSRVVDATLGNGYDALWLCELVGEKGHVYGFDVQPEAIARTTIRLEESGLLSRASLYCMGHERMAECVAAGIDAAVFNLGWLPGSDRSVRTQKETTLRAANAALDLLKEGGLLTICAYPGHGEGREELEALVKWASALDGRAYDAMIRCYLNQAGDPPVLFAVKKKPHRATRAQLRDGRV